MYKRLYLIGFAGYVFLFLLAIIFYKEPTVFCDIAFAIFGILRENDFIGDMRFGSFLTQMYPLLAGRAHLPLSAVMLVYSVCFVFYHFIYYVICGLVLKKYVFGVILLLFNILFLSHTFYWIQSEFPQGINMFMLVLAVSSAYVPDRSNPFLPAVIFLGMYMVAFMHPLIIFPVMYCLFFLLLSKHQTVISRKHIWSLIIFFFGVYLIKMTFFKVGYDNQAINNGLVGLSLKNLAGLYSNQQFFRNCLVKYYWVPVLTLWIAVFYTAKRAWLKGLLFLASMVFYLEMVNITHADSNGYDFYVENLYLPMGIFMALPLVLDILPALKWKWAPEILFSLILVTGIVRIYTTHEPWTARLNWERQFLKDNAGKKIVLDEKRAPVKLLLMSWGTPWEFWLLSTSESGESRSVMVTDRPDDYAYISDSTKRFLVTAGNFSYADLRGQYFHFNDTVSRYQFIK